MKRKRGDREKAAVEFAKKGDLGGSYNHLYDGFIAGSKWSDYHQFGVLDEDYVWNIYNFVNKWKGGGFGEISLQKALENFEQMYD